MQRIFPLLWDPYPEVKGDWRLTVKYDITSEKQGNIVEGWHSAASEWRRLWNICGQDSTFNTANWLERKILEFMFRYQNAY